VFIFKSKRNIDHFYFPSTTFGKKMALGLKHICFSFQTSGRRWM